MQFRVQVLAALGVLPICINHGQELQVYQKAQPFPQKAERSKTQLIRTKEERLDLQCIPLNGLAQVYKKLLRNSLLDQKEL